MLKSLIFKDLMSFVILLSAVFSFMSCAKEHEVRPNILWIVSEDNSPYIGAYGDEFASTPSLDELADKSIVYDNAFANTPVCAPNRFSIYTGMFANALGTENMRSQFPVPDFVKPYTYYLKQVGYHITNHHKTDYNFDIIDDMYWDKGTYTDRKPGQPFFHVYNLFVSHESSVHKTVNEFNHDPEKVKLPPYHPDTSEIRQDWARYYDKIAEMDTRVGNILEEIHDAGLSENTIVFYYSDHGGVIARSKRFLFDSGTKIPLIVHIPEKFKHFKPKNENGRVNSMVESVDLAPSILDLAGITPPSYWHGKSLFAANHKDSKQEVYLYRGRMDERIDLSRALRDQQFKYIRNFMPHRPNSQHLSYLWRAKSIRAWEADCLAQRCNPAQQSFWNPKPVEELYNVKDDPWEVNNLANEPNYQEQLLIMRKLLNEKSRRYRDIGFIPEGELKRRTKDITPYELVNLPHFPIERIIETAEIASWGQLEYVSELEKRLSDTEAAVRYWAATGFVILERAEPSQIDKLHALMEDESADVQIVAAEALLNLGIIKKPLQKLEFHITYSPEMIALHAANVLNEIGYLAEPATGAMKSALKAQQQRTEQLKLGENYVWSALNYTLSKFDSEQK